MGGGAITIHSTNTIFKQARIVRLLELRLDTSCQSLVQQAHLAHRVDGSDRVCSTALWSFDEEGSSKPSIQYADVAARKAMAS